jgi:hypothetical protein
MKARRHFVVGGISLSTIAAIAAAVYWCLTHFVLRADYDKDMRNLRHQLEQKANK